MAQTSSTMAVNVGRSARGLTLIELLASLVILSIAASLGIGVAGPMAAGQRVAAAVNTTLVALERARLWAQRAGGATLSLEGSSLTVDPLQTDDSSPQQPIRMALPKGLRVELFIKGETQRQLIFTSDGRCEDAVIALGRGKDNAPARRIEVLGLTGQTRLLSPARREPSP